jgi:type I restriction-modification system DNA methylase subunit
MRRLNRKCRRLSSPRSSLTWRREPFHGRVFDPACGSGGMFVQAEEFLEAHGGRQPRGL